MSNYRQKLQELLRELFQFDSADLDFGFYAVMNQKREQIAQFIETDLLDAVAAGLQHIADQSATEAQYDYEQARQSLEQQIPGLLQGDEIPPEALQTSYIADSPVVQTYQAAQANLDAAVIAEDMEAQIYNDLYAFFARYYQDGDFISQRRYGANDKYAIPYNGEEVHLHWANFDQYYVKTGVHFHNYSFTVPGGPDLGQGASIQVRLTKVDVPRDNVKGDKRFFIYTTDQPVTWDEESQTLIVPMEYRPLTPEESGRVGTRNQQEKLLEEAHTAILQAISNATLRARLTESDPQKRSDKDRLAYHLNRYAAENTRDFFVHKDLGGFLRREFDYYLKAEVLRLEDINFDDPIHARRAAARLKTTRAIGQKIIAFLDQLEAFQRQLFLKRKFVLQSDYCLTLDKIPADRRTDFYPEILDNKRQLAEWEKLYNVTITPETNLDHHPHLMLDTAFFDVEFKHRLLACFDSLNTVTNGLLIHGENFQALNLLVYRYQRDIQSVYIDPPYNADATAIIYKNGYKEASWLSLMWDRLVISKELMGEEGVLCVTIDDYELHRLKFILDNAFQPENYLATVVIRNNPSGRSTVSGFATNHEYALFYSNSDNVVVGRLPHSEKQVNRYDQIDEKGKRYEWENFRKSSAGSERADRPKQFFPLYYNPDTKQLRLPKLEWQEAQKSWDVLENPVPEETIILPIIGDVEKVWNFGVSRTKKDLNQMTVKKVNGNYEIYKRKYLREEGVLPRTWWDAPKYSARDNGTRTIVNLFGRQKLFDFPKSVDAVRDSLLVCNIDEQGTILDYFAGSGTTAHAVMQLNREDDGTRKYILVEMGDHFDSVLKPRIQKVAYADEWKDGKPVLPENGQSVMFGTGQSHMFHYIRLESYDDTFHNIRFREIAGPQLSLLQELPDYTLGYMLDHETAGSPALLDIEQFNHPFEYQLLVTGDDGVLRSQTVDLVTTFNFLIGLTVQTIRHYTYQESPYVCITGVNPDGHQVCALWRNVLPVDQLDAEREWVTTHILHGIAYDKLYVNGENTVPNALLIEEEFKRRMFEGVH